MLYPVTINLSVDTLSMLDKACGVSGESNDSVIRNALLAMSDGSDKDIVLDPDDPGSLVHTRVISGVFNGVPIEKQTWTSLVVVANLEVLRTKLNGDVDALKKVSKSYIHIDDMGEAPVGYMVVDKETDGYGIRRSVGFSIKKVEATRSWEQAYYLAKKYSMSISIAFEWRDKEGAKYPGKRGVLEWNP